jgi:hypothetical protein
MLPPLYLPSAMLLFFTQAARAPPDISDDDNQWDNGFAPSQGTSAFQSFSRVAHSDGKLLHLLSLVEKGVDDDFGYCPDTDLPIAPAKDNVAPLPPDECTGADLDSVLETKDLSNDKLFEYFTNGFGLELTSDEGTLHKGVTETKKSKASFRNDGEWSGLSLPLTVLPFVWHMRRQGRVHHYSDIFMTVSIVAEQLGFKGPLEYVMSRGWTFSTKDGKMRLQYRKLDEVVDRLAPNGDAAQLVRNFNAMIDHLYEILDLPTIKDIYTNLPFCRHLERLSFASKIHSHTQDIQFSFIVARDFYVPYVPDHFGDIVYWAKIIYRDCSQRKDYSFMVYNLLFLFEDENGDPSGHHTKQSCRAYACDPCMLQCRWCHWAKIGGRVLTWWKANALPTIVIKRRSSFNGGKVILCADRGM